MTRIAHERTVLLVEAEGSERHRYADALEKAGFDVLACPGPSGPDYTCVGSRVGTCPLVDGADAVVLDMALESETLLEGTAAEELLGFYLIAGRPVVVLGSWRGEDLPGELVRLRRHAEGDQVIDAVRSVIGASSAPASRG
jgi:hypothetical protein